MKYIIKIMQITLVLLLAFVLNIIPWVPSLFIESLINITIIILIFIAVYLAYQTIRIVYMQQKKKHIWKNILYTALLMTYIGLFAMLMIGVSSSKKNYVETYGFGDRFFYVYKGVDSSYEVSLRDPMLPIRSLPIRTFQYTPITLKKDGKYIYATGTGINEKIYDLNKDIAIQILKMNEGTK